MCIKEINRRLDLVQVFIDDTNLASQIRKLLPSIKDTERCLLRLHYHSTGFNDFLNIVSSLEVIATISLLLTAKNDSLKERKLFNGSLEAIIHSLGNFSQLIQLSNILSEDSFERTEVGGFIREGVSSKLDNLRMAKNQLLCDKTNLYSKIASTLCMDEFSLGVDIKYGPVLDFPKTKLASKKEIHDRLLKFSDTALLENQRSTSTTRYSFKAWTDLYDKVQKCETDILKEEMLVLQEACDKIKIFTFDIINASKGLAEVDVSAALAILAKENQYVRPTITEENTYQILGGRHPVVEYFQKGRNTMFVKNDANICDTERLWLLTGANMGGKSTFLRQR